MKNDKVTCETCLGTKIIRMGEKLHEEPPSCPTCKGTGQVDPQELA